MESERMRATRSYSASSSRQSISEYEDSVSIGDQSPAPFQQQLEDGDGAGVDADLEGGDGMLLKDALAALNILRSGSSNGGPLASPDLSSTSSHQTFASFSTSSNHPTDHQSLSASTISSVSSHWDNLDPASTEASSPSRSASLATDSEIGDGEIMLAPEDPNFMARVSQLPIVSGVSELYARSKASSRVVKYAGGIVESSLSTMARPLANNLGQLDDFACRQLDRFGGPGSSPGRDASTSRTQSTDSPSNGALQERTRSPYKLDPTNGENLPDHHMSGTLSTSPVLSTPESSSTSRQDEQVPQQAVAVASRSRWQVMLTEAGGVGAALSEESLKSLKYCLQWLTYATAHLDHQITVLRDFIISLQRHHFTDSQSNALAVTASASAHLTQIKHDVVDTIRKVVDVVSKYAGAALPEQAKNYVKQSILALPNKWASAIEGGRGIRRGSVGTASSASTPTGERMEEPKSHYFERPNGAENGNAEASTSGTSNGEEATSAQLKPTADAAERVLTFAVESLDMLKSVTQIFGESVEKADAWVERLRVVGLDRQRLRRAAADGQSPPAPPEEHHLAGTKRRRTGGATTAETTGVELYGGQGTDGEDGSLTRRKKGARSRESTVPGS